MESTVLSPQAYRAYISIDFKPCQHSSRSIFSEAVYMCSLQSYRLRLPSPVPSGTPIIWDQCLSASPRPVMTNCSETSWWRHWPKGACTGKSRIDCWKSVPTYSRQVSSHPCLVLRYFYNATILRCHRTHLSGHCKGCSVDFGTVHWVFDFRTHYIPL